MVHKSIFNDGSRSIRRACGVTPTHFGFMYFDSDNCCTNKVDDAQKATWAHDSLQKLLCCKLTPQTAGITTKAARAGKKCQRVTRTASAKNMVHNRSLTTGVCG